jgi:hypothetical protein
MEACIIFFYPVLTESTRVKMSALLYSTHIHSKKARGAVLVWWEWGGEKKQSKFINIYLR